MCVGGEGVGGGGEGAGAASNFAFVVGTRDSSTFHSSRPKDCVGASTCCVMNEEVTFDRTRVRYDLTRLST